MVSKRIVIIAATITIAVAGAVVYAISSGGSKSDPLREQGANCPELRPLSEAGDAHQSTELGKYIGELRDVKAPQLFEGASKSVADEFQRLSAVTEEEARKVVDELQTATSLDSPSPRTTLFLALLHRVAEERKRLDAVTASISAASSTIASIVANAENTYLNGFRSNEELCAMNAVHHYAVQLRDHLAAVTLSVTTATAAAQQHYAATISWLLNGTYQHYSIDLIYNQFAGYLAKAPPQLLQKSLDDVATGGSSSVSDWLLWVLKIVGYVIGGIVVLFVIVVVIMRYGGGARFVRKHYLLYQFKKVESLHLKVYNDIIETINNYITKQDSSLKQLTKLTSIEQMDTQNINIIISTLLEKLVPLYREFILNEISYINETRHIRQFNETQLNRFKRVTYIILLFHLSAVINKDSELDRTSYFLYVYFFKQKHEAMKEYDYRNFKEKLGWTGYPVVTWNYQFLPDIIDTTIDKGNHSLIDTWKNTSNERSNITVNFISSLLDLSVDQKNSLSKKYNKLLFLNDGSNDEQNIQLLYHTINLVLNYKQGQDNSLLINPFKQFIDTK